MQIQNGKAMFQVEIHDDVAAKISKLAKSHKMETGQYIQYLLCEAAEGVGITYAEIQEFKAKKI